ncbi:MAG: hypothetical protein RBG13Loki_1144 [Promethearchaeota archaeon CR_4]|nr:MAG: hypothetical protein RBG13Loki_1144 [Candidatus Lokiarchaeota archaeon CR_4]
MVESKEQNEHLRDIANLCYRCKKCSVICPVAPSGRFNPRKFIQEINLETPGRLKKGRKFCDTEEDIWVCLTCGQCRVCPQGLEIPEMVREIRKEVREQVPNDPRFTATETHMNIFPIAFELMRKNPKPAQKQTILNQYASIQKWPALEMAQTGSIAYYPGCFNLYEHALVNLHVQQTLTAYAIIRFLNLTGITPVVANDYCCGHDALWAGDEETFLSFGKRNIEIWKAAGVKTILVSCAEGFRTLSVDYPKYFPEFSFQVEFAADYFDRNQIFKKIRGFEVKCRSIVTVHDPCRSGRLVDGGHYESVRNLLQNLIFLEIVEMPHNRDEARCCGVASFRNCTDYARDMTRKRIKEAMKVGAKYIVTTCPKCVSHFQCVTLNEAAALKAKFGKDPPKVMDLFSFIYSAYNANDLL